MNVSELKAILLSLLQQIDDLRVNQDILATAVKGDPSLGDLLDARSVAELKTKKELSALRIQIEELS